MESCRQSQHQTILQHGEAVAFKFEDLIRGGAKGFRLPAWFTENEQFLKDRLPDLEILDAYHVYHDCGKPYCRTIDDEGRQHFPDHARISAAVWRSFGGDERVARLIQHDMDMHTMKPADAPSYKHLDIAPALLLTALAELHSNAEMFGGIESTSFKIKFKSLSKLGNALIKELS